MNVHGTTQYCTVKRRSEDLSPSQEAELCAMLDAAVEKAREEGKVVDKAKKTRADAKADKARDVATFDEQNMFEDDLSPSQEAELCDMLDAAVEKAHEDETLSTMRARRKTITSAKVLKANERENANKETETTKVVNAMRGRIEELENELKRKDRVERRDKLKVQRLERENTKLKRLLATA